MKTKIITLESHDDLISVRDKLSWAKTPRILLVWPKYEKVSLRLLDLKVLQRHADSLGAQLGLVTKWNNVRRDAESLGIPVFKSAAAAQLNAWAESPPRARKEPRPPRKGLRLLRENVQLKEPAWRTSLPGRVLAFATGVAAVLALAGLFIPRAEVVLNPEAQVISLTIPVNASPAVEAVSLNGEIPAQTVSMTVSHERTLVVSSLISAPRSKATGIAQFANSGAEEILIPAGTVVTTNTLARFVTLNDARLPAGSDEIVEVKIEAAEAGEIGNVEANAITIIEGTLGLSVKVTNPEPTSGGTNEDVPGATEADRSRLREEALNELRNLAEEQIRAGLGAGDLFIADTLKVVTIQNEVYSPPAGQAGAEVTLSLQAEFTAHYILADHLEALVGSAVRAAIPQGFSPNGEMTLAPLETPFTDSTGITRFALQASQATLRDVDLMQVYNLIRGRGIGRAAAAVRETLSLQNEPEIIITPSWWKWLPLIPFNISIDVN
ncbi:MAG: baseplate J/gp47 family protein [Anaerolineales bacterium]|nr:baseplate J/gp47 family protein [Anaerolineales bacterium]